jgi:predicted nucleic acid-binding protein
MHAGVELAAQDPAEERLRRRRLEMVIAAYDVLLVDLEVARAFGALLALSRRTQGPRNRADLLIAASAVAHAAGLATVDRRLAAFARRAGLHVVEPPES